MTAERAAAAHDDSMGRLLTGAEPRLRAFLAKLAPADVDDALQETMVRAWRSRHTYDPAVGALEPWLLRIAFRAFLDLRQRRDGSAGAGETSEMPASIADPTRTAELREQMQVLLACLPEIERDVLLRFHRDGESIAAIARWLGLPIGTVKSHLHRARNRIWAARQSRGDE
ncbi:MAG: sigma-70 family RNA polymerase sigma factor [Planctomycetes bacterium]|nr:sigma-70 family RNA polymerase sigma factor [Planctomycetota bacterium]